MFQVPLDEKNIYRNIAHVAKPQQIQKEMKINSILLSIAISHICPVISVTVANILSNPGFEYHTPENYNIPGWITYGQRIPNILTEENTTAKKTVAKC